MEAMLCREAHVATDNLEEPIRSDVLQAIEVLRSFGAREVYLFGSVLRSPTSRTTGDIDIAVAGLPPEHFYRAYGALMMNLQSPVDLVDLDDDTAFVRTLREDGALERVA